MNPMDSLKIVECLTKFNKEHPKVLPFFRAASSVMEEGTVLELKVIPKNDEEIITNIRVTENDLKTLEMIKNLGNRNS